MWRFRLLGSVKVAEHWLQEKAFILAWICWCFFRSDVVLNAFWQLLQGNFFSPSWTTWCNLRLLGRKNAFPHFGQKQDLFPIWSIWRLCNVDGRLNDWWHWSEEKDFVPAWTKRWILRSLVCRKDFSKILHRKGFSPLCILLCFFQSASLCECFHALITRKRLNQSVKFFVCLEVRF